jgi:hypothetical protein
LVVLAIAACSTPGHDADDADKRTGFYGGFSGGMTVP